MTEILVRTPGPADRRIAITQLVIAGWTGRDKVAMEHHIAELEALGVARPARTPIFYRAAAARLTQQPAIEVVGADSSGEVEYVLVASDGALFVGVGSDHTDRKVETYGVTVSKQMCDKPLRRDFWPFDEVAGHWDQLVLRSHATIGGRRELYQEGPVARMLAPAELIRGYAGGDRLAEGTAMFGGTLAAKGGIRPADRFEGELEDHFKNEHRMGRNHLAGRAGDAANAVRSIRRRATARIVRVARKGGLWPEGMTAFETETAKSCRSLGRDPAIIPTPPRSLGAGRNVPEAAPACR